MKIFCLIRPESIFITNVLWVYFDLKTENDFIGKISNWFWIHFKIKNLRNYYFFQRKCSILVQSNYFFFSKCINMLKENGFACFCCIHSLNQFMMVAYFNRFHFTYCLLCEYKYFKIWIEHSPTYIMLLNKPSDKEHQPSSFKS